MAELKVNLTLDKRQYTAGMSEAQKEAIRSGSIIKSAMLGRMTGPGAYGVTTASRMGKAEAEEYVKAWQTTLISKEDKVAAYLKRKRDIMGAGGPGVGGYGFRKFDEAAVAANGGYIGPGRARAFGGAASAMFISVARDTFASLASGANPMTVFLQQAPQVAQAFTMMGKSALGFFRALMLNPATWAIGGLVALGAALALVSRHYKEVRERIKNAKDLTDFTNRSFSDQIRIIASAGDAYRDQVDWLRKMAKGQRDLRSEIDLATEALKKRHEVELAIANKRGIDTTEIEIRQTKELLELNKQAVKEARSKLDAANAAQAAAAGVAIKFKSGTGPGTESEMTEVEKAQKQASDVAQAIKDAMVNARVVESVSGAAGAEITTFRKATSSDKIALTVNGKPYNMSLDEAEGTLSSITSTREGLENKRREIAVAEQEAKAGAEGAAEKLKALQGEAETLAHRLNVLTATVGVSADESKKITAQSRSISLNALQSVGGFASDPGAKMMQEDVRAIRRVAERMVTSDDGVTY